jgi:hypothetical protein
LGLAVTRNARLLSWPWLLITALLSFGACGGTRTISYRDHAPSDADDPLPADPANGGKHSVGSTGELAGAGAGGAPSHGAGGAESAGASVVEAGAGGVEAAVGGGGEGGEGGVCPAGTFVSLDGEPCWTRVCDGGSYNIVPAPLGTSCGPQHQGLCDAAMHCVDCLEAADCSDGDVCEKGRCQAAAESCSDQHWDGDETDVDCGGSCAACVLGADCIGDGDCASHACDYYAPGRCVASHCQDHHFDGDETDVDCGGPSCGVCGASAACVNDGDCSSGLCHSKFHFCLPDHCSDGVQNSGETGLDCGNGCYGCAVGAACQSNGDCLSQACDADTMRCIADACQDHHQDGAETDVDFGGGTCALCKLGKKCLESSDCVAGTSCAAGQYKVCN